MAAPDGNTNAVKWTLERTMETLRQIENFSYSPDCTYLGHALSLANVYDDVWAYWRRKWRGNAEIIHLMRVIQQRFEARIVDKTMNGKCPVQFGMFMLRHHYGWNREPGVVPAEPDVSHLAQIDAQPDPPPQPVAEVPARPAEEEAAATLPADGPAATKPAKAQNVTREKLFRYNQLHPDKALVPPIAYFDGKAPAYLPAIVFEDGYFLRAEF